jgi:hypothetical protein
MHRSLAPDPPVGAFFALALVAFGGRAIAANEASSLREFDIGDGKVTFDVADATFEQVVTQKIQPKTRVNLIVAPQAKTEKVTLRVLDLYWATPCRRWPSRSAACSSASRSTCCASRSRRW